MKKLRDRVKSLDTIFLDLWSFISLLTRKWLLWIFLVLDFIALIIQYNNPNYKLPQGYYVGFAVLGILWSSFQVYRDLLTDYKKLIPGTSNRISNLDISFVEGNEYKFSLDDPYGDGIERIKRRAKDNNSDFRVDENGIIYIDDIILYSLPEGYLEINFRIENTGDFPIDILDIDVGEDATNYTLTRPVSFGVNTLIVDSKPIQFPLYINAKDVIVISSKDKISLGIGANYAKFAAEFQKLPKSFRVNAKVDTLAEDGKRKTYTTSLDISWRPLIDLYVGQWKHYSQTDYLRLAGFG